MLNLVGEYTPVVYDGALTRLDEPLGMRRSSPPTVRFARDSVLRVASVWAYNGSVIIALLAIAARWRLAPGGDVVLPSALLLAAVAAPLCYLIVPAIGPQFFWPDFPALPTAPLSPTTVATSREFRNAMPSLHFAVSLIVGAALRPLGWIARVASFALIALTVLATLGFGEHYAIDLLFAIPFAAAVWLAAQGRRLASILCATATALPLLVIRLAATEVFR